ALGGLSYQDLYQRILSAASSAQAQDTCFAAAGLVFITGVPSVIIGAVAASTDWNQTAYGLPAPFARGEAGKVLPLALQYLTPPWVSVVGIGAVAAAVMSSMDSVLLSSASMFSHNIYKSTLRAQASDRECVWVIRVSVLLVGLAGTGLAFAEDSVFAFWLMSGDLISTLICVLHCRCANGYGATAGYLVAVTLRLLSGEPLLRLPTVLLFPGWREEGGVIRQYFPFRTLVMLVSLVSSSLATLAFSRRLLPRSWDMLAALGEEERGKDGKAPGQHQLLGTAGRREG
ncbi:unnamed protein product, partial [Coregonus sp. 'balchen']